MFILKFSKCKKKLNVARNYKPQTKISQKYKMPTEATLRMRSKMLPFYLKKNWVIRFGHPVRFVPLLFI